MGTLVSSPGTPYVVSLTQDGAALTNQAQVQYT